MRSQQPYKSQQFLLPNAVSLQLCYLDMENHAQQTEELAVPFGVENHHILLVASVIRKLLDHYNSLLQSSKPWGYKTIFIATVKSRDLERW
jgi:hypothetical protein